MQVETFADAGSFLQSTRAELESAEAANSLMLGVCERLARHPGLIQVPPCLKAVTRDRGLVLAAMMTPPLKLVVYGHQGDLYEAARVLAEDLAAQGWVLPGVLGPTHVARCVATWWAEITGTRYEVERRQTVYELRHEPELEPRRGRLEPAAEADLELVARWAYQFHLEVFGAADPAEARRSVESRVIAGDVYLWHDQRPVSMATKNRPTRNGISVSLVYTPPELRGMGYATACVGQLSRMLLASGWGYCALFADLDNAAANRVYQKIGYEPACDYDEVVFVDAAQAPDMGTRRTTS